MEMSKRFVLTLIRNEPTRRTTKKTDEQQCRRYHIHLDDLFDFFSSFLLGLVEGERDELDEPLRAGDACSVKEKKTKYRNVSLKSITDELY